MLVDSLWHPSKFHGWNSSPWPGDRQRKLCLWTSMQRKGCRRLPALAQQDAFFAKINLTPAHLVSTAVCFQFKFRYLWATYSNHVVSCSRRRYIHSLQPLWKLPVFGARPKYIVSKHLTFCICFAEVMKSNLGPRGVSACLSLSQLWRADGWTCQISIVLLARKPQKHGLILFQSHLSKNLNMAFRLFSETRLNCCTQ